MHHAAFFFHMCGACLLDWSRAIMYTCIFAFPYCFWVFLKTTRVTRCCVRAFAVRFKSRLSRMVNFFFSLRHLRKISLHDMTEEPVPVVWYPVHVVRVYSPPSTGTALEPFFSYSRTGSEKRKWQTRPNKKTPRIVATLAIANCCLNPLPLRIQIFFSQATGPVSSPTLL